jgi:hypothetical protein
MHLARETVRSGAAPMAYYDAHSQPISELLSTFAPWAFGGKPGGQSYFGSESYWEVSAPLTATGCMLLLAAFMFARRWSALNWALAALLVISWLLAFGSNTPLFQFAFHFVPGFSLFRNPGRLLLLVTFAAALLSSDALDRLRACADQTPTQFRRIAMTILAVFGVLAASLGTAFSAPTSSAFCHLMRSRVPEWPDQLFTPGFYAALHATFTGAMALAAVFAAFSLAAVFLMGSTRTRHAASFAVASLLLVEALLFAWQFRTTFRPSELMWPDALVRAIAPDKEQYRVATAALPTDYCQAMAHHVRNAWGYDSATTTRYGEALLASQGSSKTVPPMLLPLVRTSGLTRSLGMRYLLTRADVSPPDASWKQAGKFESYALWRDDSAVPRARA